MTILEFLGQVRWIHLPRGCPPVACTVAEELRDQVTRRASVQESAVPDHLPPGSLRLTVGEAPGGRQARGEWVAFQVQGDRGHLAVSHERYLYAAFRHLLEVRGTEPVASCSRLRLLRPAFRWRRPVYDLYLSQSGRTIRNLEPGSYVRAMARAGFTHLEVNSLAAPVPAEEGVPGEVYPRFYTYCPALDQFVESSLNRGTYPAAHLQANLGRLRELAGLARRYGLEPSLTCFEPRSVPERLLERYPELRGCRVDHPFRSFRPRFNLAVSHPVVQGHYRELLQNLMREVPQLGCLSVWTNDSGAGLEFTRSLYAGANGSAYLVREWSEPEVFARGAAENALGFLRLLQESAAEINPDFRVATRLEPFGPEREHLLTGLTPGLDLEVTTLLETGWDCPYRHPTYEDSGIGPLTLYSNDFAPEEQAPMRRLARRGSRTHVLHAHGPVNNLEPLLGLPFPWLTHEKLRAMRDAGVEYLAHLGGLAPPAAVPWSLDAELFRRFQLDPELDLGATLREIAAGWVGASRARGLVAVWRLVEQALRGFAPNPLYFSWGVWYRIWIRPLVPDIGAIPEEERAYYEEHLLSTHHNPTRVDLSRDVLFTLMTPAQARLAVERNDRAALPTLARAQAKLDTLLGKVPPGEEAHRVLVDLRDRLVGLHCWMVTRRNVSAWIADVHGYLAATVKQERTACRRRLRQMVQGELASTRRLLELWESSSTEFMAVARKTETTFIHGPRFGEHLRRKLELMERYGDREPAIDGEIMWRVRGQEPTV